MMSWRPPGYRLNAKDLVKALCSDETEQAVLLLAAIQGKVELFATPPHGTVFFGW